MTASEDKVVDEVFSWVTQEKVLSAKAQVLLDMVAAVLRENENLLFAEYEGCEVVRAIAHAVENGGRTVWNGT